MFLIEKRFLFLFFSIFSLGFGAAATLFRFSIGTTCAPRNVHSSVPALYRLVASLPGKYTCAMSVFSVRREGEMDRGKKGWDRGHQKV